MDAAQFADFCLDDAGDVLWRRVHEALLRVEFGQDVCFSEEEVYARDFRELEKSIHEFSFFSRLTLDEDEGLDAWMVGKDLTMIL